MAQAESSSGVSPSAAARRRRRGQTGNACTNRPTRILLHRIATTSIMLRRPAAAACPCRLWYLGLGQNGSEKEAGSSSKVAGESSGSAMERKEGPHSSGATSKQVHESLTAVLEENILVGRDSDASKLISIIQTNKSKGHVCVFGGASIGKTALVKSVCQSEKLDGMFERIDWVTIADPSDYNESNRTIKLKSDLKKKKRTNAFRSANKVKKRTDEKDSSPAKGNQLIVIDDVLSKKDYDIIKSAFLDPQFNMSQVIIITRERSIAGFCEEHHRLPLKYLEPKDAFELFRKKVKVDLDGKNLSGIAHEIVEKCGGNPHTIISVANSLQNNTIKEWKKACDHLSAKLLNDPKLKDTKRRLTSSYKNLPSDLKSCFLYLSVFPEDSIIRRRCLGRRWIAEGYSSEKPGKSAEDMAEEQFQHLVSRNMIRPYRTRASKIGTSRETYFFGFETPMHAISMKNSTEENLVLVLDEDGYSSLQAKSRARHLTVMGNWSGVERKGNTLESVVDLSCLRSLTVSGEFKSFFISKMMRLLRVLDLEDAYGLRDHDLSSIGRLYHLRYLSLRGSEEIFHLPDSLGNLLNLETLDVKGTMVTKLPSTIIKLQKLKYLRAGTIAVDEDDRYATISGPCKLQQYWKRIIDEPTEEFRLLVANACLMANVWLRGLDRHGVEVPRGIGKLKVLQTLGVVNVARGKNVLEEIEKLSQLRKLGITGINKNNYKGLESVLYRRNLQSLSMRAEGKDGLADCLSSVFSDGIPPLGDLESLKLFGKLGKLPEWIEELPSLVKLTLQDTRLQRGAVEVHGVLTNLTSLRLWKDSFKGNGFHFH